jgi:Putative Flp pilus-assembly TadE/G-like
MHPHASRGQVLIIFAGTLTVLLLMSALVIDLSWLWANALRIQRAADAAALAGVVHLPADVPGADAAALDGAKRNGYDDAATDVVVTPTQDPASPRRLSVKITAPVKTFFLGLIGMDTIEITRNAKAEYVLPVPMGSPLNYYGVYGKVRTSAGGSYVDTPGDTGNPSPASAVRGGNHWATPGNVYVSDDQTSWTTTSTTSTSNPSSGSRQEWGNFGLSVPGSATIDGVEVYVEARHADAGCRVNVQLSWNAGGGWTNGTGGSDPGVKGASLTTSDSGYVLGANDETWGHNWSPSQLANASFWVRLVNYDPGSGCGTNRRLDVDQLRVKVYYHTTAFTPDQNVSGPNGETLAPQGFWGVMLSQGADSSSGDAYLPHYVQSSAGRVNPEQAVDSYYDYAVEMQPGSTGGKVYIFDPGFCDQGNFDLGTGDNYYSGSGAVSSFYTLWADDNNTPYDTGDDRLVGTSGNAFRRETSCDAYHNAWYQVPLLSGQPEAGSGLTGGSGGRTYRLRATTYDPTDINGQRSVEADNGFGLFADATSGTAPRIYGIGAMEMLTPLPGGQTSTFYLAQIAAVHADKTMEISLWDPGDTNQNAYIQILQPTASGWTAVTDLSYTAQRGQLDSSTGSYVYNSNASNCNGYSSSSTDRVQTYQSNSRFNGCWLTIQIHIPVGYTAPQDGWWKISYIMQGSSNTNATDITTWQVAIRGNPVHLVQP